MAKLVVIIEGLMFFSNAKKLRKLIAEQAADMRRDYVRRDKRQRNFGGLNMENFSEGRFVRADIWELNGFYYDKFHGWVKDDVAY